MSEIFAISKDNIDVFDAIAGGDPNDFIFHSEFNTFKIIASALFTNLEVTAGTATFEISHGMDTIPSVYGLALFPDGFVCPPGEKERADNSPPIERFWRIEVDDTNVYLVFNRGSTANYTAQARIYLFETPLP